MTTLFLWWFGAMLIALGFNYVIMRDSDNDEDT